jgi:hypothetical protein
MINLEQKNLDDFDRKKPITKNSDVDLKFGESSSDSLFEAPTMKVLEESKEYIWIRLFTNQEYVDSIKNGDIIKMEYTETGENIEMIFASYEKKGLYKNTEDEIINYTDEVDNKILCLMVDLKDINYSTNIPFIRTLFKASRHFEYQLLKRNDLLFINTRTAELLDYYDIAF